MAESFLRRWSRRKLAAAAAPPKPLPAVEPAPEEEAATAEEVEGLPPLESLDQESDYMVFLREGVPEALKLAALRKAWASDPKIADFRGFAEYDWDFNAPGYGELLPVDDAVSLCRRAFGREVQEDECDSSEYREVRQANATEEVEKLEQDEPMSAEGVQACKPPNADRNGERSIPG